MKRQAPIIYIYDLLTKEFMQQDTVDPDPLNVGQWLYPSNSTLLVPPQYGKDQCLIFDEKLQKWQVIPDFRGKTFYDKEGNNVIISKLGNPEDEELSATKPQELKPELSDYKNTAKKCVDQDAENERLKYITAGVGQIMIYQEKIVQAQSYKKFYDDEKNINKLKDEDYPLLKASLGIDGKTMIEVVQTIIKTHEKWKNATALIEATRLQAKANIDSAKSIQAIDKILSNIAW